MCGGKGSLALPKNDRKPTMKDVAKLAGVSYQTVSYVVNNVPVITPETRTRVLEAIDQLNYTPDAIARSLRSGQSKIIGLMVPDTQNPHFWATVSGAELEALDHGYSLILATTAMNRERERHAFNTLLRQRLDGIIPLFTYPEDFFEDIKLLERQGLPVASSVTMSDFPNIDRVWANYGAAATELMDHLISLGHRRIALIHGVGRSDLGSDRLTAYLQGLEKAGIPFDERYLVRCGNLLEDGYRAAEQLLDLQPTPTAVIAINDLLAFGALLAIRRRGLYVPQDISIAGFDDLPMSRLLVPSLTTGRSDGVEIGRQCVRLIIDRLNNPDLPPQQVMMPTRLIVRESTAPCRERV
jgi:LacI family transcriptional regulator